MFSAVIQPLRNRTAISASAVALAILSGTIFAPPASAQQNLLMQNYDRDGNTRIEVVSVFAGAMTRGILPIQVTVRNGTPADRSWTLDFNLGGGSQQLRYSSSFQVSAPAGGEQIHMLLVPIPSILETGSYYRSISIEARSAGLPLARNSDSANYSTEWPGIGLSEKLADRNANRLNSAVQSSGSHRAEIFGHQFQAEMLSGDWRGYTGLDVLMITDGEWQKTTPAAQLALLEWVRLGGRLDFYTTQEPASVLEALKKSNLPGAEGTNNGLAVSLGEVRAWKWNGVDLEANSMINRYRTIENRGKHLGQDYRRGWELHRLFGHIFFNPFLVILLLIAFGVIVGPINLFVWAKPGQRHRLFVTTPIISLVAGALILLMILFTDGIGGNGRRFLLANLQSESGEKRLYVTQEQISRTGVLLGSAFEMAESVFISPVMTAPSDGNRLNLSRNNVASFTLEGQTWRGDWFQSRSEQGQFLQTVRPSRSRIEMTAPPSPDGATPPKLFSSLEFTIDELFYHDRNGNIWASETGPVSGGQEIRLVKADENRLQGWWKRQLAPASDQLNNRARLLWQKRGHFFAISSHPGAGFVDTLGSINWGDDAALIFGSVPAAGSGGGNEPEAAESEKAEDGDQ